MKLFKGLNVTQLANQSVFIEKWEALQNQCPWKSPFQSPGYVFSWYQNYTDATPIVICEYAVNGDLVGLLPLACFNSSDAVVVGMHQAEYQVWLAAPECPVSFLSDAVTLLIQQGLLLDYLKFKYLDRHPAMESYLAEVNPDLCINIEYDRPLLLLDSAEISKSFNKKNNKSKFNRLKRTGELTFKRVSEKKDFAEIIDLIIAQYDFRQGAAHDSFPFYSDPNKKDFHLNWFSRNPENFHVTAMFVEDTLVSALIGIVNDNSVSVAIITYSPLFAAHSPGKLHIMMLSQLLVEDGFKRLDLTPGGDAWKSRFANFFDKVYEYRIYAEKSKRQQYLNHEKRLTQIKEVLSVAGVTPDQLRNIVSKLKSLSLSSVINKFKSLLPNTVEMRFYRIEIENYEVSNTASKLAVNQFEDFKYFTSRQQWQTKQSVAAAALSRLERGERCYTFCAKDRLAHFGWLIPKQSVAVVSEIAQHYNMPESSAVLYDFYTDDDFRGQGLYQSAIQQMLADVKSSGEAKYVYISVLTDNTASRHVIEKMGFSYQESLISRRILGSLRSVRRQKQIKDNEHD